MLLWSVKCSGGPCRGAHIALHLTFRAGRFKLSVRSQYSFNQGGVSRPHTSPKEPMPQKPDILILRIDPALLDRVKAVAYVAEVPVSTLVRAVLEIYINGVPRAAECLSDWLANNRPNDKRARSRKGRARSGTVHL